MKRRGGGITALPGQYFNASGLAQPDAGAGRDLLIPLAPGMIRNRIGGFVPSVGEPFVAAAGQYIAPLALLAGYRLLGKSNTRRNKIIRRRSLKKRKTVRRR